MRVDMLAQLDQTRAMLTEWGSDAREEVVGSGNSAGACYSFAIRMHQHHPDMIVRNDGTHHFLTEITGCNGHAWVEWPADNPIWIIDGTADQFAPECPSLEIPKIVVLHKVFDRDNSLLAAYNCPHNVSSAG